MKQYTDYIMEQAVKLLNIDSPSGYGKYVMEYLLEDISFNAGGGDYPTFTLNIDKKYVDEHLKKLTEN